MSSITLYSLSDYNEGNLIPFTIELDGLSYEDFLKEIQQNLEAIDSRMGPPKREEWIVCDYEDIPSQYVGEWSVDAEFFNYQEAMEGSHLDEEVFQAGVSLGIPLDKIEEAYYGHFDSDEELAYEYIESTGMLLDVPDNIQNYFNYADFGRDLAMDYSEEEGHYFSSYY